MTEFGDIEPEDSWDPDDAVGELVDNLIRRIAAILALRAVDDRLHRRIDDVRGDLAHVLHRIEQGRYGSEH